MRWAAVAIAGGITAIAVAAGYWLWTNLQASDALGADPNLTYDDFAGSLPSGSAQALAPIFWRVYQDTGVSPFILAAICRQESNFGDALSPQGPTGTGDSGHGRGLMQIDDRSNAAWLSSNDWTDPYVNISKGANILMGKATYLSLRGVTDSDQLLRASVSAYNTGEGNVLKSIEEGLDPDVTTTGGNYASSVLDNFAAQYAAAAGTEIGGIRLG